MVTNTLKIMRATMLLSASVGVNVRLVGYGLSVSRYQRIFIGIMRWMVELGRIDIATEVSMLSSYLHSHMKVTLRLPFISSDTSDLSIITTHL